MKAQSSYGTAPSPQRPPLPPSSTPSPQQSRPFISESWKDVIFHQASLGEVGPTACPWSLIAMVTCSEQAALGKVSRL